MRIWFPGCYLECHRGDPKCALTRAALAAEGVTTDEGDYPSKHVDAAVMGTFKQCLTEWKHGIEYCRKVRVPILYYCWDLYPWQFDPGVDRTSYSRTLAAWWHEYARLLRTAAAILVPSEFTAFRVRERTGRYSTIIKSTVYLWEPPSVPVSLPNAPAAGFYVYDVMRDYPRDPARHWLRDACATEGVPLYAPGHRLTWDEFRTAVSGAALLVSAVDEASTGGLTLLEGYALGKPVLLNGSGRNSSVDYFGERDGVTYFGDYDDLRSKLRAAYNNPPPIPSSQEIARRRKWVESEYGDARFARELAAELRRVVR